MHSRNRRGERKAKPGTGTRPGAFETHETIEHPRPVRERNARTAVGDREDDQPADPLAR